MIAFFLPLNKIYYLPVRSIYKIFGINTFSNGMTRALVSLMKGNLITAYNYNPLIIAVISIIVYIICKDILLIRRKFGNST